jgi:cytochrome c oxidase subunit 1
MVSSVGGFVFGFSQLLFVWVIVKCVSSGEKATDRVWGDAMPLGLEWTLPSPAPYHSFEDAPEVK